MTDPVLWTLVFLQLLLGFFDVMYHHEFTERLPWRKNASTELILHAVRNLFYAVLFIILAWLQPTGIYAIIIGVILLAEVIITLWDFVEEDLTRKLPATERITHTLLALNYGAILAYVLPVLYSWSQMPTGATSISYGLASLVLTLAAIGVCIFAIRDYFTSKRAANLKLAPAETLIENLPDNQTILVTGATGFVGTRLTEALQAKGHNVIALTRNPSKASILGAPITIITDLSQLSDDTTIHSIINLAGESVAAAKWTPKQREKIISSRVNMTNDLIALMNRLQTKPQSFINASATGWYGMRDDELLTEDDPGIDCFTHEVCLKREQASMQAEELGIRTVNLRIGLVLGYEGGALAQMLPAYEFFGGGPMGDGKQWMSWIERDDLIRLIIHSITTETLSGPVNAVTNTPVRNNDFAKQLGKALNRPALFRIPGLALQLALGDLAKEILLRGQRVVPEKAMESGFKFKYETFAEALDYCLGNKRN